MSQETDETPKVEPIEIETLSLRSEIKYAIIQGIPTVVGFLFQVSINLMTVMLVGHKGSDYLAGVGLAIVTANVTGFSVLQGLATALETLGSQAYGAGNYVLCGVLLQRSMFVLSMFCIPIMAMWFFSSSLLTLVGIEEELADNVQTLMRPYCFSLIPLAVFISLQKYLQAQGYMWPVTIVLICTNVVHLPASYVLLYPLDMGLRGAGIALSFSYIFLAFAMVAYIKFFGLHKKTWFGWSKDGMKDVPKFLKLAIPGAAMVCLEWWGFETAAILIARFGEIATATQTILLNTIAICFMIPLGLSVSISNRVGNLLGAGEAARARKATHAVMSMIVFIMLVICSGIALARNYWGRMWSEDPLVLDKLAAVLPVVMAFELIDATQGVASGVLRGCGQQHIGAVANLTAYWIFGIPLGYVFAFVLKQELMGMWYGLASGLVVQTTTLLCVIFVKLNWKKEAEKAQKIAAAHRAEVEANELQVADDSNNGDVGGEEGGIEMVGKVRRDTGREGLLSRMDEGKDDE